MYVIAAIFQRIRISSERLVDYTYEPLRLRALEFGSAEIHQIRVRRWQYYSVSFMPKRSTFMEPTRRYR